ncbi:hypothetical protein [Gordonia bronchialis]|uniref:hypothetical protein n=1 Tax=Gordonia bronchialis TaxID=2054 RepID=UPI00226E7BC0|nr:hypothetical protein [Gordonia bronchialis]
MNTRLRPLIGAVAILSALGLGVTACGGSDSDAPATSSSAQTAVSISSPQDDATTVDITIADGAVTPRNARIEATVGKPAVLYVTSDELHVHSTPEHSFEVSAGAQRQRSEFTVAVPGSVAIELHEADVTVATLQVR